MKEKVCIIFKGDFAEKYCVFWLKLNHTLHNGSFGHSDVSPWRMARECFGKLMYSHYYTAALFPMWAFSLWQVFVQPFLSMCLCMSQINGWIMGGSVSWDWELPAFPSLWAPYCCRLSSLPLHWQLWCYKVISNCAGIHCMGLPWSLVRV